MSTRTCNQTSEEHCCWFRAGKCPFVLEGDDAPGEANHACGLVVEHGNWDDAMASEEWQETVKPMWDDSGLPEGFTCRDWPQAIPADLVLGGRCCYDDDGEG